METKEDSREAFELVASNDGLFPKAIDRNNDGEYLLMQTASGWGWWQAAWQHQAARIAELEAQAKQLQREPLRDEQIAGIACDNAHHFKDGQMKFSLHFARAIEAAHNIK